MSALTDENLREQLILYGEDVGPLNSSTRSYWEKRLAKLDKSAKSKKKQLPDAKNSKSSINGSSKKNRIIKPEKKPVKIQQRDKKLLDTLRENGINFPRGPLTDAMRNEYQKKLYSLTFEAASGHRVMQSDLFSIQHETAVDSEDENLKKYLQYYGVNVPNGPLNDATKHQLENILYKLMINECGVLSENDLNEAYGEANHVSDNIISLARSPHWAYVKPLFGFMVKASEVFIFIMGVIFLLFLGLEHTKKQ